MHVYSSPRRNPAAEAKPEHALRLSQRTQHGSWSALKPMTSEGTGKIYSAVVQLKKAGEGGGERPMECHSEWPQPSNPLARGKDLLAFND